MIGARFIKPKRISRNRDPFLVQDGCLKDTRVSSVYRSPWSEDVFISDNRERERVGNSFDARGLPILAILLFSCLGLLIGRTAWLQIVKGEYYYSMAEGNRIRIERVQPRRGVIYDKYLNPLVRNRANFMLYFIPSDLPEEKEKLEPLFAEISELLGPETAESAKQALAEIDLKSIEAFQPLFIKDNIAYETAMRLYLDSEKWSGVVLSSRSNREYLYTGERVVIKSEQEEARTLFSLSHLMGYTGKINKEEMEKFGSEYIPIDYIGKTGIEYFWENELKGVAGKRQIEVDAFGNEKKLIGETEALDGNNLVLSLDLPFQLKLEEIMLRNLEKLKLTRATIVAMDPRNGEVLAMVSLPAYNNNLFSRGISKEEYATLINHPDNPLINHAISGQYPSGSTIKMVMAVAALEEGVISESTAVQSTGGIGIGQWFFPDWKAGGHGRTDVRKAIAESVNTFFYYIGGGYEDFRGLGLERIVDNFERFGLGAQTGIDLAGEASGLLPNQEWKKKTKGESWYVGDTYHMSIGQGDVLVTPLQVANFTTVFANGGKLFRPHLIRAVLDSNDQPLRTVEATPVRENFLDDYNVHIVKEGMRQTVTAGSARSMADAPVAIAGKTGTAQWARDKANHAWFTGFAPFDEPELVLTVLIEEGGEGSSVAVPIAKEAFAWYFSEYKQIKAEN
jgi:penicillin-binding protein 2